MQLIKFRHNLWQVLSFQQMYVNATDNDFCHNLWQVSSFSQMSTPQSNTTIGN